MKKTLLKVSLSVTFILFALLFSNLSLHAQIINEGFEEAAWISATANPNNSGTTSGSVVIANTSANSTMTYYITNSSTSSYSTTVTSTGTGTKSTKSSTSATTLTSTGLNTSPNSGTWWYSKGNTSSDTKMVKVHSASHSWEIGGGGYLITPIIPAGIATVTCWIAPGENFFIGANTATANVPIPNYNSSSTSNGFTYGLQTFASGASSTIQSYAYSTFLSNEAQIGFFNRGNSNILIDDIVINVNPGTQASVTTGTNTAPTYTSTTVSGTITANNPSPYAVVISSGVCYSSTATLPDTSNSFTTDGPNGVSSGTINSTINGLTPGTKYCARAYALTTAGIIYGATTTCFTTLASTTPTITTNPANVLSSVAANSGGNISDSGGLKIDSSGVCWNTTGNPTLANSYTKDGNSSLFTSSITGLFPCTKYYVRAYAVNKNGIAYGNQVTFTTACVPSLLAAPAALNFGLVPIGSSATLSYTLTGALLTPAVGTVTVTAPVGCLISLTGGAKSNTLTIPYTGGTLSPTSINVYFSPTKYGYVNDSVRHAGGGAVPPNIQQVSVSGLGSQPNGVYSNVGIDFWTGFGYVEEMSSNKANMSVYIAAGDQDAVVNVDIPGLGWSYAGNPVTVAAHTVFEVTGFPTNKVQDSRLYFTGVSGRAVHIQSVSGVPVSVWTYTSASDNTAAGCMNFPTNVWNSQYTVQAFGGFSNQPYPNSYFFVIAKEDSTVVTITPTADIVDSNANTIFKDNTAAYVKYPSGVPFKVKLNKGQVYTGISTLSGTKAGIGSNNAFAADLSGTTVVTDCKNKIAVFGGNARCLIDTSTIPNPPNFQTVVASSGSDNLMQQMFPTSAWGTKYLTVPTKTMEDNYYRIFVQKPSTKVTVNGVILDTNTLINKLYYQLSGSNILSGDIKKYDTSGNHFLEIIADNAISVSQFIVSGIITSANIGNNGLGDPEMIILSPIQQSINSVTVATPSFKNNGNKGPTTGHYINVVIPKDGVKSFRIYADTTTTLWKPWRHTVDSAYLADPINNKTFNDTSNIYYSYRIFSDTSAMLVDTGSSSFTGVAYAGSNNLVYLDSAFQPYPYDTSFYFAKFRVPQIDLYNSQPASYTLTSNVGFNAIAYGMDNGESYGFNAGTNLKVINTPKGIPVLGGPIDSLTNYHTDPNYSTSTIHSCLSIPFHFTLALSYKPDSLTWNFDVNGVANNHIFPNKPQHQIAPVYDSTHRYPNDTTLYYFYTLTDASGSPIKYTFDNLSVYPVTVTAYTLSTAITNFDPCTVDTSGKNAISTYQFYVNVTKGVHPGFTPQYVSCTTDTSYKFFDNTWDEQSADTSFIIGRIWSFGNNKTDTSNNKIISTTYNTSGVYPVRLVAIDRVGCIFDTTVNQSIKIKPIASFSVSTDTICAGSSVTFIDHSGSIGKGILDGISTWAWDYGNGNKPTYTDSSRKSNTYSNYGTYPVSLHVTNGVGCDSTITFKNVYVSANPVPDFTTPLDVCLNGVSTFTNASAIAYGNPLKYIWDFGDATRLDSSVLTNDAASSNHFYTGNGAYNVTLTAYNTYANNLTCSTSKSKVMDVLYTLIPLGVDSIYHEGFEQSSLNHNPNFFPPVAVGGQRWHLFPANSATYTSTWTRDSINNIVPSEANASAWAHNFGSTTKQTDDLNTPVFGIPKYPSKNDSLYLKFDVAAKTNFSSGGGISDTLEVLLSSKCSDTWVSIYKKWGSALQTVHDGTETTAGEFKVNNKKYWRTDSVNISALHDTLGISFSKMVINGDSIRLKFRNHNNNENNFYIDNTSIYVNVDKGQGFYTSTIPFDTLLTLHDYDFRNIKSLSIYDMTGRLMFIKNYNYDPGSSLTNPIYSIHPGFNGIPYIANGMYVCVITYSDRTRRVFEFLKQ